MKAKNFLYAASIGALCFVQPTQAFTTQFKWAVVMGDGNFPSYSVNATVVGGTNGATPGTNANATCGTITAGDELVILLGTKGTSGDPGTHTGATGFTAATQRLQGNWRGSVWTKTADGSENGTGCHWAMGWTSSALDDYAWAVFDYGPSGGTPPVTPLDATPVTQAFFDSGGTAGQIQAPSITPTASNDTLIAAYIVDRDDASMTCPSSPAMTKRMDSHALAGAFNFSSLLVCDSLLVSNSATGTLTGTYGNSATAQVNGTIVLKQPTGGAAVVPTLSLLGVGK